MERGVERIDVFDREIVTRALTTKYERLLELRLAKLETGVIATREELGALARAFPGALRELDRLPLPALRRRLSALREVAERNASPAFWMSAQYMYHRDLRGALFCKAWLAHGWAMDGYALAAARAGCAEEAATYLAIRERVVSPPRGKVTELVIERIADALATTTWRVRRVVSAPKRAATTSPKSPPTTN